MSRYVVSGRRRPDFVPVADIFKSLKVAIKFSKGLSEVEIYDKKELHTLTEEEIKNATQL